MQTEALDQKINELDKYVHDLEITNSKISKASVGWHIDHSLKVINKIVEGMKASNPAAFKNNFSVIGKLFFFFGYFPRGKAKAPKVVRPPEHISKEAILVQLKQARTSIQQLVSLDSHSFVPHPFFGNVNKDRAVRFLEIHTNHHLKIIKSILKSLS